MFKKISLILLIFALISLPLVFVQADFPSPGGLQIDNPLKANSFTELFVGITNWIAGIATTIAILMIVIAGFQYMIAAGNEVKTKAALNTIKWSLIGLAIILLSWSLLKTVLTLLGVTVT